MQIDPAVLTGYGKRDSNWDITAEVQHQLAEGVGITGGYYFNNGGYFRYAFGSPFSSKTRRDGQPGGRRRPTTRPTASPRRRIRSCRAAAATRCAASPTSTRPSSVRSRTTSRRRTSIGTFSSRNDFVGVTLDARLAARHPAERRLRYRPVGRATAASSSIARRSC